METRNIAATEEILDLVLRIQDIDRSMSALKAEKERHVQRIKEFLGGKPGAAAGNSGPGRVILTSPYRIRRQSIV